MRCHNSQLLGAIVFSILLPGVSRAFDKGAHEALSTRAVNPNVTNASRLDRQLKTFWFEFEKGIDEPISGGTVQKLIVDGSVEEDSPVGRVIHHFHDPTRTWDQAGERLPLGIPLGNSSVVWSQMYPQGPGGSYSWKDARDAYYGAVTSTTKLERMSWYAKTFTTLGHLIHHVQDAAVPSHTRNDNHLQPFSFTLFPDGDPFHRWADTKASLDMINGTTQALRFDPSILDQTSPNPYARVPIARIIDKTDGDYGVLSPNLNIGLAEYSNANFISKGTARSTTYLYPLYSQLQFGNVETLPNQKRVRYARFRPGFGEQDYRVGVSSRMVLFANATVPPDSIDFGLDDNVHADYGRKLFPRAIGYSAGLIDYFFRGKIRTDGMVEIGAIPAPPSSITFSGITVSSYSGNEVGGQGTIQLAFRYFDDIAHSSGSYPHVVVSQPVSFDARSPSPQTVTFSGFSAALPFPGGPHGTWTQYTPYLIFRGPLGQELDTVVAGGNCYNGGGRGDLAFYRVQNRPEDPILYFLTHDGCPNPYTFP
jgi:hypothetical protein